MEAVAVLAGIQGAKRTPDIVPLCHPLILDRCDVRIRADADAGTITMTCDVATRGPTGVEMEAMAGASAAALALYDMCKAVCRGATIERVRLLRKEGGRSGLWEAAAEPATTPRA